MTVRNLSLFDFDDTPPEQIDAVGKSRAVPEKKKEKKAPEEKRPEEKIEEKVKEPEPVKKKATKKIGEKSEIPEDWKAEKQYYSIGEVAALFKVKTSNIRFWTNEFALKVRTTRKGDRLYNPDQIKELRVIHELVKEKGYTIAGAKAKLKSGKKTAVESIDLKQSLLQLRNRLLQIRNQLT